MARAKPHKQPNEPILQLNVGHKRSKIRQSSHLHTLLKAAVKKETLSEVSLEGMDREFLIKLIPDFTYFETGQKTTFAHQFGRHGWLQRIQHLLRVEDYDLEVSEQKMWAHEPPLYTFVSSETSVNLLPIEVFSAERLFRRQEADEIPMWIRSLIFKQLIHRVPEKCLSKENLLREYDPDEGPRTPFADLFAFNKIERIYPQIVSAEAIKESKAFPDIVCHIVRCLSSHGLDPKDFVSHYEEIREIWKPLRDKATPEATEWFVALTKAQIQGRKDTRQH